MRPRCYDRPPRVAGTWERTGRASIRLATPGVQSGVKEHLRWRPSPFEDRCATHDGRGIGPKGESYPEAHGWDCDGCRWCPARVQARYDTARGFGRLLARADAVVMDAAAALERLHGPFWGDPADTISHGVALPTVGYGHVASTPHGRPSIFESIREVAASHQLVVDFGPVDNPAHNPRVIPSFEPGLPPGESLPTEGTHR